MAEKRNLEGELTKAISHSLDFHKIVVMAIAIVVATIALHFFTWVGSKISSKYAQVVQYFISGIGWLVGAVAVLCAMVAVCKMSAAKDAGEKKGFIAGIGYAVSSILTIIFANLRYLIWLALEVDGDKRLHLREHMLELMVAAERTSGNLQVTSRDQCSAVIRPVVARNKRVP